MHVGYVGREKGFICECGMKVLSNVGLKAGIWILSLCQMRAASCSAPPTPLLLPSSLSWGKLSVKWSPANDKENLNCGFEWFVLGIQ